MNASAHTNAVRDALESILARAPKLRHDGPHGPRRHCQHCTYAWGPALPEVHQPGCAYLVAREALATPLAQEQTP